ncbi:hypothetical protein Tco_0580907 [Tanacetum coccineum]
MVCCLPLIGLWDVPWLAWHRLLLYVALRFLRLFYRRRGLLFFILVGFVSFSKGRVCWLLALGSPRSFSIESSLKTPTAASFLLCPSLPPKTGSPHRGNAQAITKHALLSDLLFSYRLTKGYIDLAQGPTDGLLPIEPEGFTLSLLDSLFSKGLRTVKSIPPKCHLGFSRVLKGALDKVICKPDDISCRSVPGGSLQLVRETLAKSAPPMLDLDGSDHDLTEQNLKQCKGKIFDGHYTAAVRVLSSSGVAPYNDVTLYELKTKHRFMSAPSLPDLNIDHHPLIASQDVVLDRIKSFP